MQGQLEFWRQISAQKITSEFWRQRNELTFLLPFQRELSSKIKIALAEDSLPDRGKSAKNCEINDRVTTISTLQALMRLLIPSSLINKD